MLNNSINILTTEEIIKIHIDEFSTSPARRLMLKGESYYKVENDILSRQMIRFENENPVVDETKANNKLAHGYMHLLVDDKVNYLLTKPYTLECEDERYLEAAKKTLGKRFQKKLSQLGTETSNKGLAWLYPYIDTEGNFKTMRIPSEQCIPLWLDNDHEELQALIRYYQVETYEGKEKKLITKIEYHTPETVDYYLMTSEGKVILDAEMYLNDDYVGHFKANDKAQSWDRVPFIPFKNNDFELPDLQFVKTLVDNYDLTRSDVANLLEEIKNIIYALRGYGGESLSEFMRDLAYYRAVKLDDDGGLDKVETTIDIAAAKEHYEALKKDIYDFGQAVDKSSDKLGDSPSGIALKFMYSGLDLKCNAMEDHFKWAFEQLLYFVNKYHEVVKLPVSDKEIGIVFNRDIAINESQAIEDCQNSKGVISNKTIVSQHPWVEDVDEEMKQIEEEGMTPETDPFNKEGTGNGGDAQ
ncbi:MAG: phage portal protein [Desulfitobacterium sp.]